MSRGFGGRDGVADSQIQVGNHPQPRRLRARARARAETLAERLGRVDLEPDGLDVAGTHRVAPSVGERVDEREAQATWIAGATSEHAGRTRALVRHLDMERRSCDAGPD